MDNKPASNDIFGIAPYGEAVKILIEKSLEGIGALLGKMCLPAAEEYGLIFRDHVRKRRLESLIKIVDKANGKFNFNSDLTGITVHPRIVNELLESGTWCDDEHLQEMWAGLLISSLETDEPKGKNILFLDSLKKLTPIQAKIIDYGCRNCKVMLYKSGLILASKITISHDQMISITGETDVFQLDAELDNLRANELIASGGYKVHNYPLEAQFCPSAFALNLFAKTQGFKGTLSDFYKNQLADIDDQDFKTTTFLTTN